MRDNHDGMPELLAASEHEGNYFCTIRLENAQEKRSFRFGVSRNGYMALPRVFQVQPFEVMPGAQYRYFFSPSVRRDNQRVMMTLRVEATATGST